MSLLSNLRHHRLRERVLDQFNGPAVDFSVLNTTGINSPYALDCFQLEARAFVRFNTSPGNYENALRMAERSLLYHLYSDVMPLIHEARLAVNNGDRSKAFGALGRMQELIEGQR